MAGGKSSRMMNDIGKDKTTLPFGGHETLVHFLHSKLADGFEEVYISAKNIKFGAQFDYCLDYEEICGVDFNETYAPGVSIYSSMSILGHDKALFVPADMPFIKIETLAKLIAADNGACDAVVLRLGDKCYPTCAVYNKNALAQLGRNIAEGKHKLMRFLEEISTIYVDVTDENELLNINNHEEYKKAQEQLK